MPPAAPVRRSSMKPFSWKTPEGGREGGREGGVGESLVACGKYGHIGLEMTDLTSWIQ